MKTKNKIHWAWLLIIGVVVMSLGKFLPAEAGDLVRGVGVICFLYAAVCGIIAGLKRVYRAFSKKNIPNDKAAISEQ